MALKQQSRLQVHRHTSGLRTLLKARYSDWDRRDTMKAEQR